MEKYEDLENILFKGFLPLKIKINQHYFVFKSVNDLEYETSQLRTGFKDDPFYFLNFHLNYLYFSIFMINGKNILKERERYYNEIMALFKTLPMLLIHEIFERLNILSEKQKKCSDLLEPYCYEHTSRYNWLCKRGVPLNDERITGIQGSERLGVNTHQMYWQVMNIREDDKESFDLNYELSKFVASFWDAKQVKKIDSSDKTKEKEEKERKERIIREGVKREDTLVESYTDPVDTAQGLVDQLNKQMRGEKDKHDVVIEEYEKKMRTDMLKQMQELNVMAKKRRNNLTEEYEETRSISPEEMAERLNKKSKREKVKYFNPEVNSDQKNRYLQMSNVGNEEVLGKDKVMTIKDYNELVQDDMFNSAYDPIEEEKLSEKIKEKQLAFKYGLNSAEQSDLDFPNLRNK